MAGESKHLKESESWVGAYNTDLDPNVSVAEYARKDADATLKFYEAAATPAKEYEDQATNVRAVVLCVVLLGSLALWLLVR